MSKKIQLFKDGSLFKEREDELQRLIKEKKQLQEEELLEEIESLQQQLQQVKDHKDVGVQFDYLIPQSGMCVCVCTGSRYDVSVLFQI